MNFFCVGATHQTASLSTREKLNIPPGEWSDVYEFYLSQSQRFLGPGSEIVILSTCNRFEVYAAIQDDGNLPPQRVYTTLIDSIAAGKGLSPQVIDPYFLRFEGVEAVRRLFRIASGLDSMVLGEPQILGQVGDALEAAKQAGAVRHTLSALFRAALHTGKRARNETEIGRNPASVSSLAATLAEHIAGPAAGQRILVIGAGKMSSLAVKALRLRGARDLTILNRTLAPAQELAFQVDGRARPFTELADALQEADLVITSTGASRPIIDRPLAVQTMQARPQRPLVLLDIALPRDVDPAVRGLPGLHVFDLEDLQRHLDQFMGRRENEAAQVEAIVEEELAAFLHWMDVIPVVGQLHRKAESIRQQEVERLLQHTPGLDPDLQDQIEHLSRSLVKKLLHEPTTRLRTEAKNGQIEEYMDTVRFLFGLDEDDSQQPRRD